MENNLNILVTGSTSGIGEAVTLELLERGYNVFGLVRNHKGLLREISNNDKFVFYLCDITDSLRIAEVFSQFKKEGISFYGAVFCAGIEESLPLKYYKDANIYKIFETNVFSQFYLLRELSKKGMLQDGGSIVTIASVMSVLGQPGKTGYCSSKAAILGLVRAAALEFSSRSIRVNAISPGVVETPMTSKMFSQISAENQSRIVNMHPLGIGSVETICDTVIYLLSSSSKWTTGQNLLIDGGYSIQ